MATTRAWIFGLIMLATGAFAGPASAAYGDIDFIPSSGGVGSVPAGWVILSSDGLQYRIMNTAGASYGSKVVVTLYSPVPSNWVMLRETSAGPEIMFVGGAVWQNRVTVIVRSAVPENWLIIQEDNNFRDLLYGGGAPYGARVTAVPRSPVPPNWAFTFRNNQETRLIHLGGAPYGAQVVIDVRSRVPGGWVILHEDNDTRQIMYVGTNAPYGTRVVVALRSAVPADWVVVSESDESRTLMYVGGAALGAEVTVVLRSRVPSGWVILSEDETRRLRYVAGSAYGTELNVALSSPVPTNWVVIQESADGRRLRFVGGAAYGARVDVVLRSPVWPNWVILEQKLGIRKLLFVAGAPEGTLLTVALSSPVPAGWGLLSSGATTKLIQFGIPFTPAPSNVTAVKAGNEVVVDWDAVPGATHYTIKRRLDKKKSHQVLVLAFTGTRYVDTHVEKGKTYYYVVSATGPHGTSVDSAEVSAAPQGVPGTPQPVATPADRKVTLIWPAVTGAKYYNVRRSSVSGGPYSFVANLISPTTFVDTNLVNGFIYYYVVTAISPGGIESELSYEVEATPGAPPAAPSGLIATAGEGQVFLSWTGSPTPGVMGYLVYRSSPQQPDDAPAKVTPFPLASTTFTDTNLVNGRTYVYFVRAMGANEVLSANSGTATATPFGPPPPPPPGAPQGLSILGLEGSIQLDWSDQQNVAVFNVKRSMTSGGPYTTVASVTPSTYLDANVAVGIRHYYVVAAENSAGVEGPNSGQVSAIPSESGGGVPPPPTALTAVALATSISLDWPSVGGAVSFNVKRSTTQGGPYSFLKNVGPSEALDTTAVQGTRYFYVVTSLNAGGQESPPSPEADAILGSPPPVGVPANLSATPLTSSIALDWNPVTGASSYRVKRSTTSGGAYAFLKEVTGSDTLDTTAQNGVTYYYVVSSISFEGVESGNSAQVSATLGSNPAPAAPTNLSATGQPSRVALSWSAVSGAGTYRVKRSLTSGGPYSILSTAAPTTYVDNSVSIGTPYFYVVSALSPSGTEGPNSAEATAAPTGAGGIVPPTGLVGVGAPHSIGLTWNDQPAATGYKILRGNFSATGPFDRTFLSDTNSYVDAFVVTNIVYYYKVAAVNGSDESGFSPVIAVRASN